jgi:hypothetical protein
MNAFNRKRKNGVFIMRRLNRIAAAAALVSLTSQLAAPGAMADSPAPPNPETQATVKKIGFGISRITLRPKAASRLDIQTGVISEDQSGSKTAPFSSIIYDLDGDAWVYTVTEPLTYVREPVVIERVTRDRAYLTDGPPAGTQVVTVGVPELYGAEVGVNGE